MVLLKPGKFYKNIAIIHGGFLVYKNFPSTNQKIGLDHYTRVLQDDLVYIIENLGKKISPGSKHVYFTYKILTKDCVGYIHVFNNTSKNWVEVTSC